MLRPTAVALLFVLSAACGEGSDRGSPKHEPRTPNNERPDEYPELVTRDLPFHYPASLYAQKVQGNVTLKLFIDRDGRVIADSTRVDEPSGFPPLDSAALRGASDLRFVPAKLHGEPQPVSILFPVYFRHPEARPLPGDSILTAGKPG